MSTETRRVHETRFDILGSAGVNSKETLPLFAYGTLQLEPVLAALIGRLPESAPDKLEGWRVARLPDRVYPGLVPDPGKSALGRVLKGITPDEWMLLDRFEDNDYDLVPVILASGTRAMVYAWTKAVDRMDWLPDEFAALELTPYVERCTAWLQRDRAQQPES
ncbi:gamma-glutamylcyclotransferase family protein [Nocardia sp. NPDC057455]|uniref:gamma-glutamylcyclotransferase family protein n=1 Tax=Nocardia sp. NPDC057455 TaxID=3346138 RepID=UPI00366C74CD